MYGEVGCHGLPVVSHVVQEQKLEFEWCQLMKKMEALHVVAIVPKQLSKAVGLVQLVIYNQKIFFVSSINIK